MRPVAHPSTPWPHTGTHRAAPKTHPHSPLAGDRIALPMASPASTTLLDHALAAATGDGAGGRVVLVEDCVDASGAFVLHHLLKRALSGGGAVLFVALAHPFSHYDRIMKKLVRSLELMLLSVFNGCRVMFRRFCGTRDATWPCTGIKIGSFSSMRPKWRTQVRTGNVILDLVLILCYVMMIDGIVTGLVYIGL